MVELERPEMLRPAEEGARLVALRQLDEARLAVARAGDPEDDEAIHDVRVALRRLRSTLTAYRGFLDAEVAGGALARAGKIAGQMGGARDSEVWLAWLGGQLEHAPRARRSALESLRAELQAAFRLERAHALEGLGDRFEELEAELRSSLSTYAAPVTAGPAPAGPRFALAASDALRTAAAELEHALAAVTGPNDAHAEHQARIAAKRVRYVLEPLRRLTEGGQDVLVELKRLQDVLGDRHDRDRLALRLRGALERAALATAQGLFAAVRAHDERAARALRARRTEKALLELLRRSAEESDAGFAELAASWLSGKDAPFLARLAQIVESLRRMGAPPQEIERKYLLRGLPERLHAAEAIEIEQGYLPGGAVRERLRRAVGPRGTRCTRTVKVGTGRVRAEYEEEISPGEFARLWPLTESARLRKRRYRVPEGALTWEIDEFLDRSLVLAEIELPTEDTEVVVPDWLEPQLVREVTGEAEYSNAQIAAG
ncbi:MAG TPA: CHAD domain-containing protein [Myxococcota bacterium]|nr:CHAD domain-containing protein [Myxococcota bacterium]